LPGRPRTFPILMCAERGTCSRKNQENLGPEPAGQNAPYPGWSHGGGEV
jgi:hypothetical protein